MTTNDNKPNSRGADPKSQQETLPADVFGLELQQPYAEIPKKEAATVKRVVESGKNKNQSSEVLSYRHGDKRTNNPHVGMVDTHSDGVEGKTVWQYDPHIDPALQFDSQRSSIENLIDEALASGDKDRMQAALEQLKRMQSPYLNWAGKAPNAPALNVDTVSLHVHERIDPATILAAVQKKLKDAKGKTGSASNLIQPDLFHAPFENLPLRDAIDFYKHERDWSNRLIAGDSLLVMNSLLQKEGMAGQVQMIYLDPPYGIKYGSNFQPFVNKRDVKDRKDEDLTQEPEMIKAFRDTWELGIHSYLTYLRDRLLLAKELLHESGSVFVQISEEKLHHVRELLDEIFDSKNHLGTITFLKTSSATSTYLSSTFDYLVWYVKDRAVAKYRMLMREKSHDSQGAGEYAYYLSQNGELKRMEHQDYSNDVIANNSLRIDNLTSQSGGASTQFSYPYHGGEYSPGTGGWKTNIVGMWTKQEDFTFAQLHLTTGDFLKIFPYYH